MTATAPETSGAAALVPLSLPKPQPEPIAAAVCDPGATTVGLSRPSSVGPRPDCGRTCIGAPGAEALSAPTETTFFALAGEDTEPAPSAPSFPAEKTATESTCEKRKASACSLCAV